jgi:hypothetical protein
VDIVFKPKTGVPVAYNGETIYNGFENGKYKFTIYLNEYILSNSSQDFILKTMFHESIHAMIQLEWNKYLDDIIDSSTFKALYPNVWNYKRGNLSYAEHVEMSNNYVNKLAEVIKAFNPALSDWQAKAIAWSGLGGPPAYNDLLDLTDVQDFGLMAKYGSSFDFDANHLKKCN